AEVQVMDWGLAKELSSGGRETTVGNDLRETDTPRPPDETQAGTAVGTPSYIAPEQARGEPIDCRADVLGLGAMVCGILTGRPPFDGGPAAVEQSAAGDLTAAMIRLGASGAEWEPLRLARRCLASDPSGRPRDAGAVAAAVAAYRAGVERRLREAE